MTEFQNTVIELLKLIAHGQRVMINAMPQRPGTESLVRGYGELIDAAFASLQSNAESEHSSHQSSEVVQE
jgi:hypothetical protein